MCRISFLSWAVLGRRPMQAKHSTSSAWSKEPLRSASCLEKACASTSLSRCSKPAKPLASSFAGSQLFATPVPGAPSTAFAASSVLLSESTESSSERAPCDDEAWLSRLPNSAKLFPFITSRCSLLCLWALFRSARSRTCSGRRGFKAESRRYCTARCSPTMPAAPPASSVPSSSRTGVGSGLPSPRSKTCRLAGSRNSHRSSPTCCLRSCPSRQLAARALS
mmetsp:Transcript_39798/g.126552  ORF Transcript_39798/g.126552 Transcript_39798/m.126552 type:complete len:222 (+) Transcript_39798:2-667(+)